mmetsp:Transcript_40635/g.96532  ORF Transcript_40635/g.96532 Transcript_40635/m.96532 type:complete len:358 (-) Transcript_40635:693-1766(-)
MKGLLEPAESLRVARRQACDGDARPLADDGGDVLLVNHGLLAVLAAARERHLDLCHRGSLVDEVDRLVGEETVRDVALRERHGRLDRLWGEPHPVVHLEPVRDAPEDLDRLRDRRLPHIDWLEAPFERRVLLDVAAVLLDGRGSDAFEVPPRESRLEEVGGVHPRVVPGAARAHQHVQLVDEEDDAAARLRHLSDDRLEPVLKLASELGACDERAHVQSHQGAVLQGCRDVAGDDALREPLSDGRFADAGLADQHGVVLRPPRQDLNRTADLVVPADDRVELAVLGGLCQVPCVLAQGLVFPLGILVDDLAAAADLLDSILQLLGGDALLAHERLAKPHVLIEREQKVLDGHVLVAP